MPLRSDAEEFWREWKRGAEACFAIILYLLALFTGSFFFLGLILGALNFIFEITDAVRLMFVLASIITVAVGPFAVSIALNHVDSTDEEF